MTTDAHREELAAIDRALTRIRRRQSRRTLARRAIGDAPVDLNHLAVVDAVEEGAEYPGQEITVGVVAERLGLDPSRASRVVAGAVGAGYVRRVASQGDGRRSCLELTDTGRAIVASAHETRQAFYDRVLAGWSPRERAEFARLLTRFTGALADASRD